MHDEWHSRVAVRPSEPATAALKDTLTLKESLKACVHLFQACLHAKVYMCRYVYRSAIRACKETLALKEALKARVHLFQARLRAKVHALKARVHLFQARLHAKVYMCKYVYQLGFWFFVLNSTTQILRFTDRKLYGFCEIFLGSIYSYINCVRPSKA